MAANISYETLLRLKDRLLERLAEVDAKLEECRQELRNEAKVPLNAPERNTVKTYNWPYGGPHQTK